ncbi:MAG: glutamine-hydrolyzing GMP synthase [Chloroflexi bacterium]|nr:glutamine-hydrolyzing GMP synthase [Chloroflexota bacterium]
MAHDARTGGVLVLDYGSQYTQLIARRVREHGVYAELYPWNVPAETALALEPNGIILSGGPHSVYGEDAPSLPTWVIESKLPVLGICYGMQLITRVLGGQVNRAAEREYGHAVLTRGAENTDPLFSGLPSSLDVWMSHGDRIDQPPAGFISLGASQNSPYAAIGDPARRWYGVQFHPEVVHTAHGHDILQRFTVDICACDTSWTPANFAEQAITNIRERVQDGRVIMGLSGGVDSLVAATLIHRAIGDRLVSIFVNTGLLRAHEPTTVAETARTTVGINLVAVDATERFLEALQGVTDPEKKRKIIGRLFIKVFEEEAARIQNVAFLGQGTIYPDVIESAAKDRPNAQVIKTHHNVGGLPEDMSLELIEPLRYLFKDEVRRLGLELGLPEEIVWRQPFPGPGLAIRCLGEVNFQRLETLRAADKIYREALQAAGLMREVSQAYAALLPVKSVGVMGDQRTYAETIVLRAVTTEDFMTADWARLPYELLAEVSNRIVNEVDGVNRVVYDISTKPPATIEWE